VLLLSDGNNMALAYVAQQNAGSSPGPISFAPSVWQRDPTLANTNAPIGNWQTTAAYGDPNLRSTSDGFTPDDVIPFTITNTAGTFGLDSVVGGGVHLPLTVNNGVASLLSPPITNKTQVFHAFNIITDSTGSGALFSVSTELNDPTDVGFEVALFTSAPVPEPETYAMMLTGLAIIGFVARQRKAV
jgi:hypothetical protein